MGSSQSARPDLSPSSFRNFGRGSIFYPDEFDDDDVAVKLVGREKIFEREVNRIDLRTHRERERETTSPFFPSTNLSCNKLVQLNFRFRFFWGYIFERNLRKIRRHTRFLFYPKPNELRFRTPDFEESAQLYLSFALSLPHSNVGHGLLKRATISTGYEARSPPRPFVV